MQIMKKYSLLLLGLCTIFLWTGCKKKGCTDQNASNFDVESSKDDGSCEYLGCTNQYSDNYNPYAQEDDGSCDFTTLESIIDVPWYRVTDSVLYSFKLDPNGTWITRKNCQIVSEGSWEIDYDSSTLIRYFNGIEETYSIIEPSPTKVKFRGISNGNSDISADNSLIVYEDDYTISDYNSISKGVKFEEKWSVEIENDPSATFTITGISDLEFGDFPIVNGTVTYCDVRDLDWSSLNVTGELFGRAEGIFYGQDPVTVSSSVDGFLVTGSINWDMQGMTGDYYKGQATWTIEITEVVVPY